MQTDYLNEALQLETSQPKAALEKYKLAGKDNTIFYPKLLIAAVVGSILGSVAAFYITAMIENYKTPVTLIILVIAYIPFNILLKQEMDIIEAPNWFHTLLQVIIWPLLLVIFADLSLLVIAALVTLGSIIPLAIFVGLVTYLLKAFILIQVPFSFWVAMFLVLYLFWLVCSLADITPDDVFMNPLLEVLQEIPVGLIYGNKDLFQFLAGVCLSMYVTGNGILGMVYPHLWQFVLINGLGGLFLGLTFSHLPVNYVTQDYIFLGKGRCYIRLGRFADARYLLKKVGQAPPYMSYVVFPNIAYVLHIIASPLERGKLFHMVKENLEYAEEPRYGGEYYLRKNLTLTRELVGQFYKVPLDTAAVSS